MSIDRFPVEAGHIALFARAIGDPNPAYYGALTGDEPVPAPPTFAQASAQFDPDYFLRPKIGQPWFGSGREATGIKREQWRRRRRRRGWRRRTPRRAALRVPPPARAGDVLTGTTQPGNTWEKQGRRGGKLVFSESVTEYRDQNGELVVTARGVGVRTETVVQQEA